MNKIKKFKMTHTILFCIAAEIIWLALLISFNFGLHAVAPKANYFILMMIQEGLGIAVSLLLLKIAGKTDVLSRKGSGIGKGMLIGMFLLVVSFISGVSQFATFTGKRNLQPLYLIAIFIVTVFFVGMTEEFLFRGLISTLLIEKFGTSRKGIWKAAIITTILFGCAHISNMLGCGVVGVLVQVALAGVEGLLLTAIYFRSGSIWTVAILHGCIDMAGLLTCGLYGFKVVDTISNYRPINLVACVVYMIPILFLLRSRKLPEIEQHFHKDYSAV